MTLCAKGDGLWKGRWFCLSVLFLVLGGLVAFCAWVYTRDIGRVDKTAQELAVKVAAESAALAVKVEADTRALALKVETDAAALAMKTERDNAVQDAAALRVTMARNQQLKEMADNLIKLQVQSAENGTKIDALKEAIGEIKSSLLRLESRLATKTPDEPVARKP